MTGRGFGTLGHPRRRRGGVTGRGVGTLGHPRRRRKEEAGGHDGARGTWNLAVATSKRSRNHRGCHWASHRMQRVNSACSRPCSGTEQWPLQPYGTLPTLLQQWPTNRYSTLQCNDSCGVLAGNYGCQTAKHCNNCQSLPETRLIPHEHARASPTQAHHAGQRDGLQGWTSGSESRW